MAFSLFVLFCEAFAALLTADAITGYIHYVEDKHPEWITRLLGEWGLREVVEPNIDHHNNPFAMTRNRYWERNNTSIFAAVPVLILSFWLESDFLLLLALIGSQANQIHYYAHLPADEIPSLILFLQSIRVLQSRRHHSIHHAPPHDRRFCVMTPWINNALETYQGRRPHAKA